MPEPSSPRGLWQRLLRRPGGLAAGGDRTEPRWSGALLGAATRLGGSLIAIALMAGSGLWTWQKVSALEVFRLKHIELRGAGRLSDAEILGTASIAAGQPLLKLPLGRQAAALVAHPWVESVEIRRHLPDRLRLDLVEQVPRALLMLDELWIVNLRGEPFKRFEGRDQVALPVLSGFGALAQRPEALRAALTDSLGLMDHLTALRPQALGLDALHHDDDLGVSAVMWMHAPTLDGPLVVHLGPHPTERTPQLLRTLDDLSSRGIVPREIWLDGQRKPAQVTFRPMLSPPVRQAEKSQSRARLRTIAPTSVARPPRPSATSRQRQ